MNYSEVLPNFSGQIVGNGRFELVNMIGSGSYGNVYRALDARSDPCEPVYYAIKCLPKTELSPERLVCQRREILLHSLVSSSSPHICTLHEIIEEELYIYFVLDYCAGGDLYTAIIENRIYQNNLLDGLHACHQLGVYHRDLKPENVLCCQDGLDIRIADFGLATKSRLSQEFGVGSSYYMSPECISREMKYPHYSPLHTDIWSLGVILVNMVSGRNPWRFATPSDEGFLGYLYNVDFLREILPISRPFNEILKRIFRLQPFSRISLPELREEILKLDTFYMSDAELRDASDNVREAARDDYYRRASPLTNLMFNQVVADTTLVNRSSTISNFYSDGGPPYPKWAYRGSAPTSRRPSDLPPASINRTSSQLHIQTFEPQDYRLYESRDSLSGCSMRSVSSGVESEGPITPETHAHEPAIDVADLSEGQTLDEPMLAHMPVKMRPKGHRRFSFRNVVSRFKIF
ncbi:serine/threonine protein kinase, negative regulator of sexual conjugation and meiosis [Suillus subalutaceus]|uniref:serine/threonine protein kinase, negative regulator of sexual conjugation and meiosis n=1 Tax=Suillus subalutaceus TaxID=48586 RepID=UPI001B880459|nr:serine/threonine protein kinase, negative regulator of sexual conjugation and meiosis [Suillus subalutaceus]KAG1866514.1 serine/threonine protein kinase, negative regulator of sexual conjugation and meiosis [Suillus subalutaceus]